MPLRFARQLPASAVMVSIIAIKNKQLRKLAANFIALKTSAFYFVSQTRNHNILYFAIHTRSTGDPQPAPTLLTDLCTGFPTGRRPDTATLISQATLNPGAAIDLKKRAASSTSTTTDARSAMRRNF